MSDNSDSRDHRPAGTWVFDEEVVHCFGDMLTRSIPDLATLRALILEVGARFVQYNTDIVDLGASYGDMISAFYRLKGAENNYVAVEPSSAFIERLRDRFGVMIDRHLLRLDEQELDEDHYPPCQASLTLAILTLQFCPIEARLPILRRAWEATKPGGALILAEKVSGSTPQTTKLLRNLYYDFKRQSGGYSHDAVEAKAQSLRYVLAPLPVAWNEDLLRRAGWQTVECFWRNRNFAAWIAIKDK